MASESDLDNYIHLKYDLSSNTEKVRVTKECHICKCINTASKKIIIEGSCLYNILYIKYVERYHSF